jgi:hypothetical protein
VFGYRAQYYNVEATYEGGRFMQLSFVDAETSRVGPEARYVVDTFTRTFSFRIVSEAEQSEFVNSSADIVLRKEDRCPYLLQCYLHVNAIC